MDTHATKVAKNLSYKYSHKLLHTAKTPTTDAIKTASKRVIQKTAEKTDDLIGNKTTDKIASVSKPPKELHSNKLHLKTHENETDIPKKYIYLQKKDKKLLMN